MSDFSIYKGLEISRLTSNSQFSTTGTGPSQSVTGAANVVSQAHTREQEYPIANLTANTSEAALGILDVVPYQATLKTANVTPSGAAVASGSAYASVNLYKRTNGGSPVLMATANLANVTVNAFVPIPFTLVANAANTTVLAGDVITANVVQTGAGTANNLTAMIDFNLEDI